MDAHCLVRRHLRPPLRLPPSLQRLPPIRRCRRGGFTTAVACRSSAANDHHQERPWESYDRDIQPHAGSDLARSLRLLADMQAAGMRASAAAYARLIRALSRAGRTLEAEALLLELRHLGAPLPDAAHYNALLEGLLARAHLRLADRLLLQMADDGVARNHRTYTLLLDAYARAGRLEDSWWVLGEMRRRGVRLGTAGYSALVRLYRDNGMWKKATDLVLEMQEVGVDLDVRIYNGLIDTFGKYGQLADARRVFEKMRAEGIKPDIATWNALIRWHCRVGNMKRALRYFAAMQEEGMYPDPKIFITIISRLGEQGKWDELKRLFDKMRNRGFKDSGAVYAVLVDIYGQYGLFRDARECVAALKAEKLQLTPSIFCVLANAYAQQGLCDQTVSVLQLMEAEGIEPNLVMLNLLINAFSTAGRHLEAVAVFQHIKDSGMSPDVVTYTTLMKAFMRVKRFEKVLEVYNEMERAGCTPDRKAREMLHDATVTMEQMRYRAVTSAYYRGALGAMVVYDVTRRSTFEHVPRWVEELRAHADGSTVVSLVGNKADLAPAHRPREVTTDEAAQLAEEQGLFFSEASALTGDNVERAFMALLEEVFAVVSRRALQLDEARRERHGGDGGGGGEVLSLKGTRVDLNDPIMETSAMKKSPSSQCACS